jgi:two-component system, LytTR family, sensor kinase
VDGLSQNPALSAPGDAEIATARMREFSGFVVFQSAFWGLFMAIRAIAAASVYPQLFWAFMGPRIAIVLAYAAVTSAIHVAVNRFARWSPVQRLWLTLALCALSMLPLSLLEDRLSQGLAVAQWPAARFTDYLSQFGWVLLAWAGYDFARDYARTVTRQSKALAEAQALAHAAQIKMLRYQLNPHFLFNSLNAISALVLEGRNKQAEDMLIRLSRFLRHTIDSEPSQLTRLGDEVVLQRHYLEMEAVRFGDKLRVQCLVPEDLHDVLVPSLLLQPIVENAIKHGVSRLSDGGEIIIRGEAVDGRRLILSVENDGPGYAPPPQHNGVGLRNTRDRLAALYGADASFAVSDRPGGGVLARFDLPLNRAR